MSVSRVSRISLAVLLATALVAPAVSAAPSTVADPTAGTSRPLAELIAPDGTLRTDTGFSGAIDLAGWSLAGDISAGSAPRFTRTPQGTASGVTGIRPAAAGDWSALGSNGSGNGALRNRDIAISGSDNRTVSAIAISGPNVYVGGIFANAGGIPEADYVAKWNGTAWSGLGSNGSGNGALSGIVNAIAISGTDIYVGGSFNDVAGIPEADRIAKWNGTAWSALGSNGSGDGPLNTPCFGPAPYVTGIAISATDVVYVVGTFINAAGKARADYIAKWNGTGWAALGSNGSGDGAVGGISIGGGLYCGTIGAVAISGTDIYVGGLFLNVAGIPEADRIAKWNGTAWSALGSNGSGDGALGSGSVSAVAISGTDVIYVGGAIANAGGIPEADYVAKWNGTAWSALGSNGSGNGALNNSVAAIAISGTDIYVGGSFNNVAGIPEADYVAKWNGTAWSALGSTSPGIGALNGSVRAIAISGTDIYVGGQFTNAAGIAEADWIARYDDGPVTSTLTLSTNADSVKAGQTVRLGAFVTGDAGTPTGKVAFRVGSDTGTRLGFCELNINGRCSLTTDAIPAGTRRIWARYVGDAGYLPDTAELPLKVVAAALPAPEPTPVAPEPTPDPGASPAPSPAPGEG